MSRTFRADYYGTDLNPKCHRDKKKGYKPPSGFKKTANRQRRAKERDSMRQSQEIPLWKKTDTWKWN